MQDLKNEKQSILHNEEYLKLIEAKEHLVKNNKKITNDRLIVEMTFGLWVYLQKRINHVCGIQKTFF